CCLVFGFLVVMWVRRSFAQQLPGSHIDRLSQPFRFVSASRVLIHVMFARQRFHNSFQTVTFLSSVRPSASCQTLVSCLTHIGEWLNISC
ncbi:MAG: hypothetical protein ABJZ55_16355, partial [Fuerstiella sp.]